MDDDPARVNLLGEAPPERPAEPPCFADLGLDHVVAAVVSGRAGYHLEEYFWTPLRTVEAVAYRQEAMRDLERPELGGAVRSFGEGLRAVRSALASAGSLRHVLQRRTALLDAALTYVTTVRRFNGRLATAHPTSRALTALADHVTALAASPAFTQLADDAARTRAALDAVTYRLLVAGDRVSVTLPAGDERDYAAELEEVFGRVGQSVLSHVKRPSERAELNHVEEAIVERVAALYPQQFGLLERFAAEHRLFLDPVLGTADRDLQFYLAGLEFAARLRAADLPVCWPDVGVDANLDLVDSFDPALAVRRHGPVVLNDARLTGGERVAVVTGPNQGGKTTFARMVGAIAWLAALGLPVPGRHARLPLPDQVLTHFGRSEELADLRGALEDDLLRLRGILDVATPRSLVILNEVFTSTTAADAVQLSRAALERILDLGSTCVWVTFLAELAEPPAVSLVSQVDPEDPTVRTFRVVRQPAGGPTWAESLATAQGLDRDSLRRRLAR